MALDLSPDRLAAALAEVARGRGSSPIEDAQARLAAGADAAVAALVRYDRGCPEVLLMERAVRPLDRWSGQIALPGGRASLADPDLFATVVRETREEVGRDLARSARCLGALPRRPAIARGRRQSFGVTPYVFAALEDEPLELGPEAADAFWLPLDLAARGSLDSVHAYTDGEIARELPCWRLELTSERKPEGAERCIWGMTYFMLRELVELGR